MERRADFPQILVSAAAHRRPRGRVPVPFQFMRDARLSMGARLADRGIYGRISDFPNVTEQRRRLLSLLNPKKEARHACRLGSGSPSRKRTRSESSGAPPRCRPSTLAYGGSSRFTFTS